MLLKSQIRFATTDDCRVIAEIYNQYLGNGTMDLETKTEDYYRSWLKNKSHNEVLLVILVDGQLVGWGMIKRYSDRQGYVRTAETSVYLDGQWLRKGLGSLMKRRIMTEAKNLGYKHLVAKIWASNQVSIKYNLSFGYEIVGTQRAVGYVNNKWVDVVLMQYVFE